MIDSTPLHLSARQKLQEQGDSAACRRLFHGRGKSHPGLEWVAVDLYPPVLLVTLFRDHEPELLNSIISPLKELMVESDLLTGMVVQHRYQQGVPTDVYGDIPEDLTAWEHGLQYAIQLTGRQNIGFFPDMTEGRRWLIEHSAGKRVLNLFSYTCALSVAALAGGASHVVNIDMSRRAIQEGWINHQLNGMDLSKVTFLSHEIFRSMKKLRKLGPYDLVIVDPPSRQPGSFVAEKDYARLVKRLPELLAEGGGVLSALNSPHHGEDFLDQLYLANGFDKAGRLPQPADFFDSDPQASLKLVYYRYNVNQV